MSDEAQEKAQLVQSDAQSVKNNTMIDEKLYNISSVIEGWFQKHFHGVHGLEITLYNRFHAAKEELKEILQGDFNE